MRIGLLLLAAALAACSSNPADNATAADKRADDPSKDVTCTYERPVGSFLKEKKCTTQAEREKARLERDTLVETLNGRDSGIGVQ